LRLPVEQRLLDEYDARIKSPLNDQESSST